MIQKKSPNDKPTIAQNIPSKQEVFLKCDLIVIASSTGGPSTLEIFFQHLPKHLTKPILLVQHIQPEHTKLLAEKLSTKTQYTVKEAKHGEVIQVGYVYIAPGGHHMKAFTNHQGSKTVGLIDTNPVNGVRPAADVLFRSIAKEYQGKNILAIILTGMGRDGLQGVKDLKMNCNTYTICQSEVSCVVFGMPKVVIEENLADEVLDIKDMARRIGELVK